MRKMVLIGSILFLFGCAKVSLQTSQPLKVDISMKVDIYQHVVNDVDSIEGQIYGNKKDSVEKKLNALFSFEEVYAQDSPNELSLAIENRKARVSVIEEYFSQGYIGENKNAYLEIIMKDISEDTKREVELNIKKENADRETIYKATANKNSAELAKTQKIFFDDHYKRAPSGYWFEVDSDGQGNYTWIKK